MKMKNLKLFCAFLSTFTIFAIVSVSQAAVDSCFEVGQCTGSVHISSGILSDEYACLDFCKATENCTWFTFSPVLYFCELFKSCSNIDTQFCPDCLSGEKECTPTEPQCWVEGECNGIVDHFEDTPTKEDCLGLCQNTLGCRWVTYHQPAFACLLFQQCDSIDDSCLGCLSGERRCDGESNTTTTTTTTESTSPATGSTELTTESTSPATGSTELTTETWSTTASESTTTTTSDPSKQFKVMVAIGQASGQPTTDNVEIIDLSSADASCSSFPRFPYPVERVKGEVDSNGNPIICGGAVSRKDCKMFDNGSWKTSSPLNLGGFDFAISKAPFQNDSVSLVLTGGFTVGAGFDRVEVLADGQWENMPFKLPVKLYNHCMVRHEGTSLMVIGGQQQTKVFAANTFILNLVGQEWTEGPTLNHARQFHACSRIPSSVGSSDYSIIVAGGNNGSYISSVEILDDGSNTWRAGPDLPTTICCGVFVEHPAGGVVLIGGKSGATTYLDTIYYLPHAGPNAEWELLDQKFSLARGQHTAFIVTDEVASHCYK